MIVRTIFDLMGTFGRSARQTAAELNSRAWPTPAAFRGKKYKDNRTLIWTADSVRLIVRDEQYKGVVTCSRTKMVGKRKTRKKPREEWQVLADARTEALVTPELWEAARKQATDGDVIGRRTRAKRAAETRNEGNFALYRGLIFCGLCGAPLRPVWSKGWNREAKDYTGAKVRLYRCDGMSKARQAGGPAKCHGRAVYEHKVESAVWGQVVKVATDEGLILREVARLKLDRPGETAARESRAMAEQEAAAAARRLRNLTSSLAEIDDAEDRAAVRAEMATAKESRDRYQQLIERIGLQLASYESLDREADTLLARCRELTAKSAELHSLTPEERRQWLLWLRVSLTGNAEALTVRFDMGLDASDAVSTSEVSLSYDLADVIMPLPAGNGRRKTRVYAEFSVSDAKGAV